jgi:hypothetical protein
MTSAPATKDDALPPLPAATYQCKPGDFATQLLAVHLALTTLEDHVYPLWVAQKRINPITKKSFDPMRGANHIATLEVVLRTLDWIKENESEFRALVRDVAGRKMSASEAR